MRRILPLLTGILILGLIIVGCSLNQLGLLPIPPISSGDTQSKNIPLSALILQSSDVPFSIGFVTLTSLDRDLAANAVENIRGTYNSVVHTVIRFSGDKRANWEYHHTLEKSALFTAGLYGGPPSSSIYRSPTADDWLEACTPEYCETMARYGDIVSIVSAPIREAGSGLTMKEYYQLTEAVDKRIATELRR